MSKFYQNWTTFYKMKFSSKFWYLFYASHLKNTCGQCPPIGSDERKSLCEAASSIINVNEIKDTCLLNPNVCPNHGKCVPDKSQSQGYVCQCDEGFEMKNGQCTDIDECRKGLCTNGLCRNKAGTFDCQCPSGFHLSGIYWVYVEKYHINSWSEGRFEISIYTEWTLLAYGICHQN